MDSFFNSQVSVTMVVNFPGVLLDERNGRRIFWKLLNILAIKTLHFGDALLTRYSLQFFI